MDDIKQLINIQNRVYVRQIKKISKMVLKSELIDECKNNLYMAGDLLIDIIKVLKDNKVNIALISLRNVYEMILKGIVLDQSEEIRKSYNEIVKDKEKDTMKEVRNFIGENYNCYFKTIENDPIIKEFYGKGILSYIHDNLCKYSHATKVNEIIYFIGNKEENKKIFNIYINMFLIQPIILMYIDAVCTKLNIEEVADDICAIYGINMLNIFNKLFGYQDKIKILNEYINSFIGKPNVLLGNAIENENSMMNYFVQQINLEIKNNKLDKEELKLLNELLEKYFTRKELQEYNEIMLRKK